MFPTELVFRGEKDVAVGESCYFSLQVHRGARGSSAKRFAAECYLWTRTMDRWGFRM